MDWSGIGLVSKGKHIDLHFTRYWNQMVDLELNTQNQEVPIKNLHKQIVQMESYIRQQNLLLGDIV